MAPNAEPVEGKCTVFPPTIVTESNLPDGTKETVVGNASGRSTSTEGGGEQIQRFEGRPSQDEDNVADALHRLKDKLNDDAGARVWEESIGQEDTTIDGTLKASDGRELNCQVTRVERDTLPARGRDGHASSEHDKSALSAHMVTAIRAKALSSDPTMILVLDANDAPAYTDDPGVAGAVRDELAQREDLGRWAQVWLIGPTGPRTSRLDLA